MDWFDDDSIWTRLESFLFPQNRIDAAEEEAKSILSLVGKDKKLAILDLCCGVGRHSLAFARLGHSVIGVDRTRTYLQKAQVASKAEGLDASFEQCDMREYCNPQSFDLVVNLYSSFGYFVNPEDDHRVMMNVFESLRADGVLIIDTMGKEVLARIFKTRTWQEHNGKQLLQEHTVTDDWSWIHNRWILIDNNSRTEFELGHRLYSAKELEDLAYGSGFKTVKAYGSLSATAYDEKAHRLVIWAVK